MTLMDSILLQINQKKTSFNELLTRIIPNYSSTESARAALSRVIKNLVSFGYIQKTEDFFEITEKGKKIVESKLQNKMLNNINSINDLLQKSQPAKSLQYLDDIVRNLQIFLERSKEDTTLLKIGKTSATFYISDLEDIKKNVETRLINFEQSLDRQIMALKDLNFEDQFIINLDENAFSLIKELSENNNISELVIDCDKTDINSGMLFETHSEFTKKPDNVFVLKLSDIAILKKLLLSRLDIIMQTRFKVYIKEIVIYLKIGKLYFTGPYNQILAIKENYQKKTKSQEKK
ncbi:MAG TPA: hypothetical protein PLK55_02775 [archaeon]|jgi:predicted transcriptional regulator|nr:hypothetical protein [archaeon]